MIGGQSKAGEAAAASLVKNGGMDESSAAPRFRYDWECRDKDGNLKWTETTYNVVATGGKNDLLDKYFAGSAYTAAWYLGLISSVSYTTGPAAGDVMNSHGGWTEAGPTNAPNYSAGTRPSISWSAASGGSKASSSAVSFTFSAGGTVKGGFITSNSTKDGTTGILYSASTFSGGDKVVANTDVVNVTVTVTQT